MNIVKKDLRDKIDELLKGNPPTVIAIDGMSGAGKSTLSQELAEVYGNSVVIHIDDYYDCSVGRLKWKEIEKEFRDLSGSHKLLIVEGVYSFGSEFDFDYDLKIFMEVSREEQRIRIKNRNPDLFDRYVNEWIPRENEYFEKFNIKEQSDICLRM